MTNSAHVLLRMTDSGSTYLYWRWLDDPENPKFTVLTPEVIREIDELVSLALVDRTHEEETAQQAVFRALGSGPFSSLDRERQWSGQLSELVLPPVLAQEIMARAKNGQQIVLRVLPSPNLSRVPWELLPLSVGGPRILEKAKVRLDAPAVVNSNRGRNPLAWDLAKKSSPLYLLEPETSIGRGEEGKHVIGERAEDLFAEDLDLLAHQKINRILLGQLLRGEDLEKPKTAERFGMHQGGQAPSRLFYYGHASSQRNEPGSAAIHLTDGPEVFGVGELFEGTHRPFTALDLLSGTDEIYSRRDASIQYPIDANVPGAQIWPMPPRVAIIACESGADHRALETFGLVMALLNAGAELVTTTRWTLATDHALTVVTGSPQNTTTELALVVDRAHQEDDPVSVMRSWQLEQLSRWEAGEGIEYTPLIWAALTTHIAPERPVTN